MVLFGLTPILSGGAVGVFATESGARRWLLSGLLESSGKSPGFNKVNLMAVQEGSLCTGCGFDSSQGSEDGATIGLEWTRSRVKDLSIASRACISTILWSVDAALKIRSGADKEYSDQSTVNQCTDSRYQSYLQEETISTWKARVRRGGARKTLTVKESERSKGYQSIRHSSVFATDDTKILNYTDLERSQSRDWTRCSSPQRPGAFSNKHQEGLAEIFLQSGQSSPTPLRRVRRNNLGVWVKTRSAFHPPATT